MNEKQSTQSEELKRRFLELKASYNEYPNIVVLAEMIEINLEYSKADIKNTDLLSSPFGTSPIKH